MPPVFVDIGAHRGQETGYALSRGYEVYAFEPNPDTAQHLLEYQDRAFISYAAAWNADGFAPLYMNLNPAQLGSSLYPEKSNVYKKMFIYVQTINFGQFLQRLDRNIAVLKINAEGAEYKILRSVLEHFDVHRIGKVWVEDHSEQIQSEEWDHERHTILKAFPGKIILWTPKLLEEL